MARDGALPPAAWEKWEKEGKPRQFTWRNKVIVPMSFMFEDDWQGKPAPQVAKAGETELQKLQEKALALWDKEESNALELGKVLVAIKEKMGHGNFGKWWKEKGLSQNRVSYCMRLAEGTARKDRRLRNGTGDRRVHRSA